MANRAGQLRRAAQWMNERFQLRWRLIQLGLRLARRFRPIVRRGQVVYVLRWDDVREVLSRPADFSVAPFGFRMSASIGAFFLGMDPSAQYDRESSAMRGALAVPDTRSDAPPKPSDAGELERLRLDAARTSGERVRLALQQKGELDVVSDLANVVPLEIACRYFGIPAHPELRRWFEQCSYYVFAPAAPDWEVPASRAGEQIAAHVAAAIAERRAATLREDPTPDDVLARLLDAGSVDDDAIRRSLVGTFSGATIPTSWIFIQAIDRLLRLPASERRALERAARVGDRGLVRSYVIEAARFFPFPFFILRRAESDTRIAGTRIPRGATLNLVMGSASRDQTALPAAARFRPGRPDAEYMLFGHDRHACMGRDIAETILTEMALAIFQHPGVRRAAGLRGYIQMGERGLIPDGSYPRSFILKTDG